MLLNFFKNIFKIYKTDVKKICTNWVSLVVLGGLVLLPSLYAWINIYASWDPYGNTSGIKVGIVNQDKGSKIKDTPINIGKEVTESLKHNKNLGWIFFEDADKGIEEVNQGNVYATIIIPENFSKKMGTLLSDNVEKPELAYYVNEKVNAIAPKITDKGATTIQNEITTSFIEAVANKILEVMKDTGLEINKDYDTIKKVEHALYDVDKGFPQLETGLDFLSNKIDKGQAVIDRQAQQVVALQNLLNQLMTFNDSIGELSKKLESSPSKVVPKVRDDLILTQTIFSDVASSTRELKNNIVINKPLLIKDIDGAIGDIESMRKRLDGFVTSVVAIDQSVTDTLNTSKNNINDTLDQYQESLEALRGVLDKPSQALQILKNIEKTNTKLADQLKNLRTTFEGIANKPVPTATPNPTSNPEDTAQPVTATEDTRNLIRQTQLGAVADKLYTLEDLFRSVANVSYETQNVISDTINGTKEKIDYTSKRISEAQTRLNDAVSKITTSSHKQKNAIEDKVKKINDDLSRLQDNLGSLSNNLGNKQVVEETLGNISQLSDNIAGSLQNVINLLDQDLVSAVEGQLSNIFGFFEDTNGLLKGLQGDLGDVQQFAEKLGSKEPLLASDINKIKQKLPDVKQKLDKLVNKMDKFNQTVNGKKLLEAMIKDNSDKSNFLASPVLLKTHQLYPMANYGAAMTPFYTTLCLWVGALLLCALLSTKAKNVKFEYTPVQEYFGKYALFATLAALQGFIASMGDLFVLGVEVKHKALFVALAVTYSIIFTGIVYTLVSLFGNIGKAVGVVLLVLQLAGAGGTFPVQVMPQFFQNINSFLPFTYAIAAMREAIAGVVYEALVKDIGMLIVFYIIFMVIGSLLKNKANAFLHQFAKKLGESGVIEH